MMRTAIALSILLAAPAAAQDRNAPVVWGGEGRMGVIWTEPDAQGNGGFGFTSGVELSATFQGRMDNGTRFGFTLILDEDWEPPVHPGR